MSVANFLWTVTNSLIEYILENKPKKKTLFDRELTLETETP